MAAIIATAQEKHGRLPGGVLGFDQWHTLHTSPPRGAVLVLGPPGSGKTSGVMIPSVLIAPGACVSSSLKTDVMEATWRARAKRGRVWHFDPAGGEPIPEGVTAVHWSPLVGVHTADDALAAADRMAAPLRPGERTPHFLDLAQRWLSVLMYAAAVADRDMPQVATWAMTATADETLEDVGGILAAQTGEDADVMRRSLTGLMKLDPREQSGVLSTLDRILTVYQYSGARAVARGANFDPAEFVRSSDTLYITARADRQQQYAPLLAGLLEVLRLATYDRARAIARGTEPPQPHVLYALDEADKTAPMPIPAIVAEAGGQGLHLVIGLQSVPLAVSKWGDSARDFLTLCTVKVILRGVLDRDTTQALAAAAGRHDVRVTSWGEHAETTQGWMGPKQTTTWRPSESVTTEDVLTPGDIAGVPPRQALVFFGDPAGQAVQVWGRLRVGMHYDEPLWLACAAGGPEAPTTPPPELPDTFRELVQARGLRGALKAARDDDRAAEQGWRELLAQQRQHKPLPPGSGPIASDYGTHEPDEPTAAELHAWDPWRYPAPAPIDWTICPECGASHGLRFTRDQPPGRDSWHCPDCGAGWTAPTSAGDS